MKRRLRPLLLIAAGTAALVVALEVLLRVAGYSSPGWYAPHPQLGWALRPGVSGWFTDEGRSFVRINTAGQRDREHSLEKPGNVYRIAVLGDAFSEGMQVALDETYWALLPERLESCGFQPGRRIEVLNFGVRGYGTAQAYLALETRALPYRPDLVLLQFTHGNDVRDNSFALDTKRERPYFALDQAGVLRLDASFHSHPLYLRRAAHGSEVLRKLSDHVRLLQLAREIRSGDLIAAAHARSSANEAGLELAVLDEPRDALWKQAWDTTEALIGKMGELASARGAKLAVVTVPYAIEVHPDAALRASLLAKYGVPDFAYPDRRIASFAQRNGLLAIPLAPQMQALAHATGKHLYGAEDRNPGFDHWNALGHRAAAEIIAKRLCAE